MDFISLIEIDFRKEENKFYLDHLIDGKAIFPGIGYFFVIWDEFARHKSIPREQLPVIFENVGILKACDISEDTTIKFKLNISKLNGDFQMYEGGLLSVTGRIRVPKSGERFLPLQQKLLRLTSVSSDGNFKITKETFYKEFSIRGYDHKGDFSPILSIDLDKKTAELKFDKWVTFVDGMIQLTMTLNNSREQYLPTHFQSIHCDPRLMITKDETQQIVANGRPNYVLANGIEIYGFNTTKARRRPQDYALELEKYVWLPYIHKNGLQEDKALLVDSYVQILEEMAKTKPEFKNNDRITRLESLMVLNGLTEESLVLKDIIKEEPTDQLVTSDGRKLSSDLLNNLYFDESLLRPAIDIILENTSLPSGQEFNVLETNLNQQICYKYVIKYLKDSFYKLNVKYSVYNPIEVDSDLSDKTPYEKVVLNFSKSTQKTDNNLLNLVIIREGFPMKHSSNELAKNSSEEDVLNYFYSLLASKGFLLILRREDYTNPEKDAFNRFSYKYEKNLNANQLISLAKTIGFSLVCNRTEGKAFSSVLLFRKVDTNKIEENVVIPISHLEYNWINDLKNEMRKQSEDNESTIWLVSDNKQLSGIVGFINCLRKERGGHRIRCITGLNLNEEMSTNGRSLKELINSSIFENDLVMNVYENDELGSFRALELNQDGISKSQVKHAFIKPTKSGNKMTFPWIESKHNLSSENEDKCLIKVFYSGLNPSDLKKKPDGPPSWTVQMNGLCSEFSGLDQNGNRVFGINPNGSLATTLLCDSKNDCIPVPLEWSLEQACTVPWAYGTAYYALIIRAQLQYDNSILIHSGNGYMGMAAINIAQSLKCQVYTTVPSEEAKNRLLEEFPDMDNSKVINTSMECFEEMILNQTLDKGLDFVFDYSNDFPFDSSLFCLKQNGKYLFINDNQKEYSLGLNTDKNITIERINFGELFPEGEDSENLVKYNVLSLIEEGIANKIVRPFKNTVVFDSNKINIALQSLSIGGYSNKVVVKLIAEENNFNELTPTAVHNTHFESNRTFIITGGLGGFGLELANWLVVRGAGHIVLTSRTGIKNNFQEFTVNRLRSLGAQVLISTIDGIDPKECEQLVEVANGMAPVAGIFVLALVLRDGFFNKQTSETMEIVLGPKGKALDNLDMISRQLCPHLKYFVAFSSLSSMRGNLGQTSYAYANSYMERLCEARRAQGLPALAIQWGAIGDVGVVVKNFDMDKVKKRGVAGTMPQRIHSCLSVMNHFLRSSDTVVSSFLRYAPKENTIKSDKN